jgi:hypothetical protein
MNTFLPQTTWGDPGGVCENGSLKNKGVREECVRGFVSKKPALSPYDKDGKTHAKMSSAA